MAFCGMPPGFCQIPGDQTDGKTSSPSAPVPHGAGAAVVCTDVIWAGRQSLRVYFLNPDILRSWELTTDTIIEWANGTPERRAWEEVMLFSETENRSKADIRVEFSEKEISWSTVGMCAEKVKAPKPTMVLNLIDPVQCPSASARRSLVIHEFGHALGLCHEHQRHDFWKTVEPFMDTERMMDDERVKRPVSEYGKQTIGTDWFKQKDSLLNKFLGLFISSSHEDLRVEELEYDPTSIMHYGFDITWIKDRQYHDRHNVKKLNEKERKYIGGIHTRHGGLAESASDTDIGVLRKYYQ